MNELEGQEKFRKTSICYFEENCKFSNLINGRDKFWTDAAISGWQTFLSEGLSWGDWRTYFSQKSPEKNYELGWASSADLKGIAWRVAARSKIVRADILFRSGVSMDTRVEKNRSIVEQLGLAFKTRAAAFESFGKCALYSCQNLLDNSGMSILLFFGFCWTESYVTILFRAGARNRRSDFRL